MSPPRYVSILFHYCSTSSTNLGRSFSHLKLISLRATLFTMHLRYIGRKPYFHMLCFWEVWCVCSQSLVRVWTRCSTILVFFLHKSGAHRIQILSLRYVQGQLKVTGKAGNVIHHKIYIPELLHILRHQHRRRRQHHS